MVRTLACVRNPCPVLKVEQKPVLKARITQRKTVVVSGPRPLMKFLQLGIGPIVFVDHQPCLIRFLQVLFSEVFCHSFQNLERRAAVFVLQTGHVDYSVQIIEKSKILRFCFDTLCGDDKHLAITPLA